MNARADHRPTRLNFQNYRNAQDIVIPPTVQEKMRDLGLRLKDILWTFNFPMRETMYLDGKKCRRLRWFGQYWTGIYCKWSEAEQKWVILTCWREDVASIP